MTAAIVWVKRKVFSLHGRRFALKITKYLFTNQWSDRMLAAPPSVFIASDALMNAPVVPLKLTL
jgi:hypothetical protein